MDLKNRRAVRSVAAHALADNPGNPRLTVIVYAAIAALSALAVSALTTVLDNRIATTGGLSNLGLRSVLSTIRSVVPMVHTLAFLCVQLGYQSAALRMARRRAVEPRTLLDGFRCFGPLLRAFLLQNGLYLLLCIAASYAASFLYLATPLASDFFELLAPLMSDPEALSNALYADAAFQARAIAALWPVVPIALVIFLAVAAPFMYQYRMVNFCLLDNPRRGALASMRESAQMMKGHRLDLLKLDFGFWWYYLALGLASVVCYGDVLLPLLGVSLPWSGTVSYYVFYIAYLVIQSLMYYFFLNRVETTYATVYEKLRPKYQPNQGGAVLGNIFDLARDYEE